MRQRLRASLGPAFWFAVVSVVGGCLCLPPLYDEARLRSVGRETQARVVERLDDSVEDERDRTHPVVRFRYEFETPGGGVAEGVTDITQPDVDTPAFVSVLYDPARTARNRASDDKSVVNVALLTGFWGVAMWGFFGNLRAALTRSPPGNSGPVSQASS